MAETAADSGSRDLTQLPYAAEYAKTSRSTCKGCKTSISQGTLRMSAREPSRFFDGLQDNWFHYACFWKKLKKGEINERSIKGMDWLKWEDQEKIREKIVEHTGISTAALVHGGLSAMDEYRQLCVEYARSARGKCGQCGNFVEKGVMKFGKKGKFYHFECLFLEGKVFNGEIDEIQGFDNLEGKDKECLRDALFPIKLRAPTAEEIEIIDENETDPHDEDGDPAAKRARKEIIIVKSPEEMKRDALRQQAEYLWELRKGFEEHLTTQQMVEILTLNKQEIPTGKDRILDRICDCALFGRPVRCPKCPSGQLGFSSTNQTYICTGHMTAYTKCTYTSRNPPRTVLAIPQELSDTLDWIGQAPFNKLSERVYNDLEQKIVSPSKAFAYLGAGRPSLEGSGAKSSGKSGKSYVKNGTAVDAECEYAEVSHVYKDEKGELYAVSLCSADMTTNRNSYYKMQLLKHDSKEQYFLFRSWGRVGTNQGGSMTEKLSKYEAIDRFESLFLEKTGNKWKDKKYFSKKAGHLGLVETDYSELEQVPNAMAPGSKTTLPPPIVEILKMIFDVENMKTAMKDYEIDTERMPLGKLSKRQLTQAYSVLKELQDLLGSANPDRDLILDATNRFYTLIPHNFGMSQPTLLDNLNIIKEKSRMLDSLLEIEYAYGILKQDDKQDTGRDPVDVHYEKLRTKMEVLSVDSPDYKMVQEYMNNTHGVTHTQFKFKIVDVIRLERLGEREKFKMQLGTRKLLWHGSAKSNYAGILGQGLRIAPPEAPATGYMFGKGVYFADMVSKSANYCRISRYGDDGLLLLADVALGKIHEERAATGHSFKSIKQRKADSCKGVGQYVPDPDDVYKHPDGFEVPKGKAVFKAVETGKNQPPSLIYNEFIVYDVDQIQLRYLVRTKFNHYK